MQKNNLWVILGKIAMMLWSLICLVIFMYFPGTISQIHGATLYDFPMLAGKLSRIPIFTYLLDVLASFLGLAFFGTSCTSLGMKLAVIFQLGNDESANLHPLPGTLLPTYFLLGNAAFSLVFLTLASLSHLSNLHTIIILSLGLLSGLGQFRKIPRHPTARFNANHEKIVAALSIAILAISLFQSSARISYDASSTYFSNAKLTALENHTAYYLENTFVASIFQSTIVYSAVIQVFGDQAARMVSWLLGVVTIPFSVMLASYVGASKSARRILPALILTSTAFLDLMGDGKVDLFSSAYSLAAVYWFLKAGTVRRAQSRSLFVFSGCLIGFACILRPQNTFLLGTFVLIHTLQRWRTGQFTFRQLARRAGWMALGAGGFALYHLAINKIILGSPFAFWSVVTKIDPANGPWDYNPNIVWIYRLLYPFVVTFKNSGASLGNISPLVMAFLPALAIKEVHKRITLSREASQLYITTGLVLMLWIVLFFTVVEARYVIFLWIILFIPIAEIIAGTFESQSAILRRTSIIWVALLLSFILIRSAYISTSTYSPIDKHGNPHCFNNALCDQVSSINEIAGPGERVLALSAFRYYLRTDLFACSTNHIEYKMLINLPPQNAEEFWLAVYRGGYKYIVYEEGYAIAHVQLKIIPNSENTPDWIKLEYIFGKPGDDKIAYRIAITDPPVKVETTCKQNNITGIWELHQTDP